MNFSLSLKTPIYKSEPEPSTGTQPESCWEPSAQTRQEAERLLERPNLLAEVVNTINDLGVTGERPLVALAYLVATSRLLEKPLYLLVQGEPGSGKSFILQTICQTLPPPLVETVTDLTPQALYYLAEATPLKNRVLFLGERRRQLSAQQIDATKAIRELHETGRISKMFPTKQCGKFTTSVQKIEGAPAILESASHSAIAREDLDRLILAWTDDSTEQTRRVIEEFAQRKASGSPEVSLERLETIRAVQWLLEPWRVSIPFLPALVKKFPDHPVKVRRIFFRLVALIEASALLHQRQRQRQGNTLFAHQDDVQLAWKLLSPWVRNQLGLAPAPATLRIWEAIKDRTDSFTNQDLVKHGQGSPSTISKALGYLCKMGAIALEPFQGRREKPFRVINPSWAPGDLPFRELLQDQAEESSS